MLICLWTENDANVLSNIVFEKPDTVAVPILIDRFTGRSWVNINRFCCWYLHLSNSSYQIQPNEDDSTKGSNISNNISTNDSNNEINNQNSDSTNSNKNSNLIENSPDISGSTVLAIMRSKDSGVYKWLTILNLEL